MTQTEWDTEFWKRFNVLDRVRYQRDYTRKRFYECEKHRQKFYRGMAPMHKTNWDRHQKDYDVAYPEFIAWVQSNPRPIEEKAQETDAND